MGGTRWIKILKDMWSNKARSILVILSIAVGVAAVGMITNAAQIIQRDLYSQYKSGNPALLQIYLSPFEEQLAKAVGALREVEAVQARRVLGASILFSNGKWEDIGLNVLPDYENVRVSKFSLERGAGTPKVRQIVLERQSAHVLGVSVGDQVRVETEDDRQYTLTVAGIIHDLYVRPYNLLGEVTGYISMDTLEWMGEAPYYNQMDIVVSENKTDKEHVLSVGNLIRERVIEPAGYKVARTQIPGVGSNPGDHWAHNQIKGFLLILQIMGVMATLLSGGLVINTITAILTQQIKQIGIMRSMGGDRRQLAGMYLFNVALFSILGLAIAIPLGLLGAWWLAGFAAGFLNFDVSGVHLSWNVLLLQLGLGLLMPIGVAVVPVVNGTRISVYKAIYQQGLTGRDEARWVTRLLGKIRSISPQVIFSFRNTFRKKGRLAFTLTTLTLAGAMFIAVFSTRASLTAQINEIGRYLYFDASLELQGGANKWAVQREALRVPGVQAAEGWASAAGVILRKDASESEQVEIVGLPFNTATVHPLLLNGIWLQNGYTRQVVVNDDLLDEEPQLSVGDQVEIKVGDEKQTFLIIGVLSKHLSGPRVYMDENIFGKLTGRHNQVDMMRVLADPDITSSPAVQDKIATALEERFKNALYNVGGVTTQHELAGSFTDVFDIILIVLVIMAALLALVGGLGLAGTMGINVLERTREIGVLRAVGASNFTVRKIVVLEGLAVGFISWVLGAFLSGPSGRALASAVVGAVLQADLRYQYSVPGLFIWLGIVLLIGVVASLAPARRAVLLRVREVLDYE